MGWEDEDEQVRPQTFPVRVRVIESYPTCAAGHEVGHAWMWQDTTPPGLCSSVFASCFNAYVATGANQRGGSGGADSPARSHHNRRSTRRGSGWAEPQDKLTVRTALAFLALECKRVLGYQGEPERFLLSRAGP